MPAEDVAFAVESNHPVGRGVTRVEPVLPDAMRWREEMRLEAKARAKVMQFHGGLADVPGE